VTYIEFHGVEFSDTKPKGKGWNPVKIQNQMFWYKTPTIQNNPVSLKCSCEDSRFRWERPLALIKSLIGSWRRYDAKKEDQKAGVPAKTRRARKYYVLGKSYVRKTPRPPAGRPYANPNDIPGFCKHVHSLRIHLQKQGLIKLR
jgi:hypothetical protein